MNTEIPNTLSNATVRSLIDEHALRYVGRPFLICPQTNAEISYQDLKHMSEDVFDSLQRLQVPPHSKIAILLDNGIGSAQLFLSLMYCGYVSVPLNCTDTPLGWKRTIEDSDAHAIFLSSSYADQFQKAAPSVRDTLRIIEYSESKSRTQSDLEFHSEINTELDTELDTDTDSDLDTDLVSDLDSDSDINTNSSSDGRQLHPCNAETDALIAYTSGSTGLPKGALFSHHNLLIGGLNTAVAHQLGRNDVSLCVLPLYHMNAQIVTLMSTLISGGTVVIPKNFNVQDFWMQIAKHRCTWSALVPTIISQLVQRADANGAPDNLEDIRRYMRFARSSSAPLNSTLHVEFENVFKIPMLEAMGMTEAGGAIFSNPLPPKQRKLNSPGLPFGFEVKVLNDDGETLAPNNAGELWIKGESIMKGYFKQDALSRTVLREDGFLCTGDIAKIDDDGYVFITGRTSQVIQKGAEKISPREVENIILQDPSVAEAAVIGVPDRHWGNEIVAFVTIKKQHSCSESELLELCRKNLGIIKAPRTIVILDEFPRAVAHKIDKTALLQMAPKDARESSVRAGQSDAEFELIIHQIWSTILKQESIESGDDFFSLGGTSLLATAVSIQLKDHFGVDVGLHEFIEYSTIEKQALLVTTRMKGKATPPRSSKDSQKNGTENPGETRRSSAPARLNGTQRFPLTPAQERVWLHEQLHPEVAVYNECDAARLSGKLDHVALRKAIQVVVQKHEILRMRFDAEAGIPYQQLSAHSIEVNYHERTVGREAPVGTEHPVEQAAEESWLRSLLLSEIAHAFDLKNGLPVRFDLIRLSEEEHVLLLVMHHLVCDRRSIGIFLREISNNYNAMVRGKDISQTELPLQFGEYALQRASELENENLDEAKIFWRQRLESVSETLQLPLDRAKQSAPTYAGAKIARKLPEHLATSISTASKEKSVSPFSLMTAALATVIYKYTEQPNFALALPIEKRQSSELQPMIGFFADTHFLSFDFAKQQTIFELVEHVKDELALVYKHSALPLESILPSMSRAIRNREFIPVLVNHRYEHDKLNSLTLDGIQTSALDVHNGCSKFELTVAFTSGAHGTWIDAEYNTDLFDLETIERLLSHYEIALKIVTDSVNSTLEIEEISLMSTAERKFLLEEVNISSGNYPRHSVHALFQQQTKSTPDAPAVLCDGNVLTYKQLDEKSNHISTILKEHGVSRDQLVGLFLERSADIVVTMLSVLKAGGAYVPLDWQYPAERVKFMIEDADMKLLLTHRSIANQLPNVNCTILYLDDLDKYVPQQNPATVGSDLDDKNALRQYNATAEDDLDALAYVTYTSGSTGKPKGVQVPHRGIVRLLFGNDYATFDTDERILHHSAVTFDLTTFEVFAPLLHGGCCVVHTARSTDVAKLAQIIAAEKITTMWLTASLYNELIAQFPDSLSSLRQLIIGGEALSVQHTVTGLKTLVNTILVNGYGPTENTTLTTCYVIPADLSDRSKSVPIGKPITKTTVYIFDKHLKPVPIGLAGELYTGGDGLARGYHNRPDLTNERFILNPLDPKSRLYKTGDRARFLPDGNIEYLGRMDDQVKLRGFRIEPGEIDRIIGQHADVQSAVTIVRDDTPTGRALVSYIVPKDLDLSIQSLCEHLKRYLPLYMVPSYITQIESLPLNPSGKLDRKYLPKPQTILSSESDEPQTSTEEIVLGLMSDILGAPELTINDDFFDFGGHSFLALKLIDKLSSTFKQDLPVAILFDYPTASSLATYVTNIQTESEENEEEKEEKDRKRQNIESNSRHSLLKIKPGGKNPPLFFTPGGDGTESAFLVYAKLARHLPDTPFFGLRARGITYGMEPHLTVEAMAREYLKEVRRVQPSGPYYFAGECVGGVIAYEMARQVQQDGEKIALLLLLDCQPPTPTTLTSKQLKWAWSRVSKIASQAFTTKNESNGVAAGSAMEATTTATSAAPNQAATSVTNSVKDIMWSSYQKTLLRYRVKPYSGKLNLLLNEEYAKLNLEKKWRQHVNGTVETVIANGDHTTYIRDHAAGTASHILRLLQLANDAASKPKAILEKTS